MDGFLVLVIVMICAAPVLGVVAAGANQWATTRREARAYRAYRRSVAAQYVSRYLWER